MSGDYSSIFSKINSPVAVENVAVLASNVQAANWNASVHSVAYFFPAQTSYSRRLAYPPGHHLCRRAAQPL